MIRFCLKCINDCPCFFFPFICDLVKLRLDTVFIGVGLCKFIEIVEFKIVFILMLEADLKSSLTFQ